MDNLQRQLFLKKMKQAEGLLGEDEINGGETKVDNTQNTNEEEMYDEETEDQLEELPSMNGLKKVKPEIKKSTTTEVNLPLWSDFFSDSIKFTARNHVFQIYYKLPTDITDKDTSSFPIFIFHHGAGSSGLSFAQLCSRLDLNYKGKVGFLVYDARGHGQTSFNDTNTATESFDLDEFVEDEHAVLNQFYTNYIKPHFNNDLVLINKVGLLLVGHSLGGSISTSLYDKLSAQSFGDVELKGKIIGVVMLDIVEEAAIAALAKMDQFLQNTPNSFNDLREAIDWHVNRGMPHNLESAKISIPPLFNSKTTRVTDLKVFEKYWGSWFQGLSSKFIGLKTNKLLIIAMNEHLDKDLIVGQMQGKYQLVVFQQSGHFIQEDCPRETAGALQDFIQRNDTRSIEIKSNWGSPAKK